MNVATAVCAAVYEGVRQLIAQDDLSLDAHGRIQTARANSELSSNSTAPAAVQQGEGA